MLALLRHTTFGAIIKEELFDLQNSIFGTLIVAGECRGFSRPTFGVKRAKILGQVVNEKGFKLFEKHKECIRSLVKPAAGNEMMTFLGLLSFLDAIVVHSAEMERPLYEALKETNVTVRRKHVLRLITPS